jgi:hypothetical protein
MADRHLLVDPASAADGRRGDYRAQAVLDEQRGTDPICFEYQRRGRPVDDAQDEPEYGRPLT